MKPLLIFIAIVALVSTATAAAPPQATPTFGFLEQNPPGKAEADEDKQYADAKALLDESKYSEAAARFDQIARTHGRRADAAIYWKAYAQNKMTQRAQALASIAELRQQYPQSRWLREAGALELEIKNASGVRPNPEEQPDEELKLLALNSLIDSEPDRAIPIIEKILAGNSSPKLKDRALFVLGQSGKPQAHDILVAIAKSQRNPELQDKAIHNLGIAGDGKALADVYNGTTNVDAKRNVLHGLMVAGDQARVFAIAKAETNPDLKRDAIHQLGVMGAHEQLHELYKTATTSDIKLELLHSMAIGGDTTSLIDVAKGERDPEVRKAAIHGLGISGSKEAGTALVEMYNGPSDPDTKRDIIHALFIQGDAHDLVTLARKETNVEMKKELVHSLSIMGSKEANDYLIELLNK